MAEFDERSVKRIVDAVHFVEGQPRNTVATGRGGLPAFTAKYAITSSTITAADPTATPKKLGKGTATLQLVTYDSSGNATYAAMSYPDVTVYTGGASIASGRLVQVKEIDGRWHIDVDYC